MYSMTSEDVDFYASPNAAKAFADKISDSKIHIPEADNHTPNSAVVEGTIGGRVIKIDFLHSIKGVDAKSIKDNYVTLTGSRTDTGAELEIRLLHPLDCLRSRLSNINDLKRYGLHSVSSAKAAMLVLDSFIDDLLEVGWIKDAQSTLRDLQHVIRRKCLGQIANQKFGIDPTWILEKYLTDNRLDERWRSFQLASSVRRLKERADAIQRRNHRG
jgi:hypothetical protein